MESNTKPSSSVPKIVAGIVAVLLCCACVVIAVAVYILYQGSQGVPGIPTLLPPIDVFQTPSPTPEIEGSTPDSISTETLQTLQNTLVPENNPYELACRLKGICDVSKIVPGKTYQVGDKENFWVLNSDTVEYRQIAATLLYITPHAYFWAEDGAVVDEGDMKRLMDTFDQRIYPTDREFFGSEWTPGVDEDPHIFVIYADGLGGSAAGYFNTVDPYNPLVKEHSNAHETFMLSTTQDLADEYTYTTLAHEFVHMIQFPSDRNDVSWIGEGFAEVGSFLNGYGVGNFDWIYVQDPDLQLNTWGGVSENNRPHYGQSFLYLTYFLDRFGKEATQALNTNPENSLSSVDDTLADLGITDPLTGKTITAEDIFMDWAAALYLMDGNVGDGRYTYHNYPEAPQTTDTDVIDNCSQAHLDGLVNQYGIDYITIECPGDYTLTFTGSTTAALLPTLPHSGSYVFWSNKGDESDMTLTREFDLINASGPAELSYWTWYDIEEDWDYLYLEASTDGMNWEIIKTPSGTDSNPSGDAFGWGYTGQTAGWRQETVDLSKLAGHKTFIRFEYITDAAVNGQGFMLDDVRIDAINYQSDFDVGDDGWEAKGFARVDNVLPQTYRLSLIIKGAATTVTQIPLKADQTAEIPLSLASGDEAILIVTGTTRFTRIPAAYQIEVK